MAPMTTEMRKFGFRIQTRGGSTVDNLVVQGRDREEAERKLRQIYHHCTVLEAKVLADPVPADSSDLEGVISLIAAEDVPGKLPGSES
jgi:hypothetical protein